MRGFTDSMLCEFDASGSDLLYSTMIGGSFDDRMIGLATHSSGDVVLTGTTYSFDYPTTANAWDRSLSNRGDLFVTRIALLPEGCDRFGGPSASCAGLSIPGALSRPGRGVRDFALTCSSAGAGQSGVLLVGLAERTTPLRVLGVDMWLDPAGVVADIATTADARGRAVVSLPVPDDALLVGARLAAQFAWSDGCAPAGLAASSGIRVTIQP